MIKETISRDVRTDLLYKEFSFDIRLEYTDLPTACAVNSKAECLEDGSVWKLNGSGIWTEQTNNPVQVNAALPAGANIIGKVAVSSNPILSAKIAEIMTRFAKNTAVGTEQTRVRIPKPAVPVLIYKASMSNPSADSDLTVKLFNRRTFSEGGLARVIETGTAQAVTGTAQAGDATHITLAAGSSAVNDYYNGKVLTITAGTGIGQIKTIIDYDGATKIAEVSAWETVPDATSVYLITESDTGIMLAAASSADDDHYNAAVIRITAGTGSGQSRTISDYTGATKVATVSEAFDPLPDNTSVYVITVNATHVDLGEYANPANDYYNGCIVTIVSGTGEGQSKAITDYVGGTTNTAEVESAWDILPDGTSAYTITLIRDSLVYTGVYPKAAGTVLSYDSDLIEGLFAGGCDVYYQVSNDAAIPNLDASRFTSIFILEEIC